MGSAREAVDLRCDLASASEARRFAGAALRAWGLAELSDDVELAASELVTNAVLHAGTGIRLSLERHGDGVRLEVADGAADALPVPRVQPAAGSLDAGRGDALLAEETMTGRGMTVVQALADAWGVARQDDHKVVWAEFSTGRRGEPPPSRPAPRPVAEQPLRPVRLTGVPVRLAWASDANIDDLVREFQVARGGRGTPAPLVGLAARLLERLASMRNPGRDVVRAALEAGQRLVDVDLAVPDSVPADLWQLVGLLEQVSEFCREGALLSLAPTDELRSFRRWFVEEIERQLRGAPPTACPFPVVPADDPEVSAAIRAANERLVAKRDDQAAARLLLARLEGLQNVTARLADARDFQAVADIALGAVVEELRAHTGSLCVLGDDGVTVRIAHELGYPEAVRERWHTFGVSDDTPASEAIRTGEAVYLRTVEERDARYPIFRGTPVVGDRALAVVPIASRLDRPSGALVAGFAEERSFEPAERSFLAALAASTAQAMERVRLLDAERASGRRLAFLAEASALLSRSLRIEDTVVALTDLAVPRIGDWCSIHLLDGGRPKLAGVAHVDPRRRELARELQTRYPVTFESRSAIARCLATGEGVRFQVVPDSMLEAIAVDADHLRILRELGFGSGLVVPLSSGGNVLGALALANEAGRIVTDEDWEVAQDLGTRAGAAIANALLYAEQARAGAALRNTLLPSKLPEAPGIEFAATYRPATSGVDIGGDFYDVVRVGDGWLVVIGDVRGHGVDAGAVATLARHTLRGSAGDRPDVIGLAERLNAVLLEQDDGDPFLCTAALAAVTLTDAGARAVLCSAGHPDPVVLRDDGRIERPVERGDILGLDRSPRLAATDVELGPGDALVLYTDGIVERHDGRRSFDDAGVTRVLGEGGAAGAQLVADRLVEAATGFADGAPSDDMAVVVMRLPRARRPAANGGE